MNNRESYIDYLLKLVLHQIGENTEQELDKWKFYISVKSRNSTKHITEILNINTNVLSDFEIKWKNYFTDKKNIKVELVNSLRLIIILEYIIKSNGITKSMELQVEHKQTELSIKQVRVLELVIRDLIYEKFGPSELLMSKLSPFFKSDQINGWVKNADETGLLSGTTFSELSSIFLLKDLFVEFEKGFQDWQILIVSNLRETLRFAFDDIRLIRNQIAHNKKITVAQIELMNIYYLELTNGIKKSPAIKIDFSKYFINETDDSDNFLSKLKEDRREYWYSFLSYLETNQSVILTNDLNPSKNHWMTLVKGKIQMNDIQSGISINVVVNNNNHTISVEIFIISDEKKYIFDHLKIHEFNNLKNLDSCEVVWNRLENSKASYIRLQKTGDFLDKNDWDIQFSWLNTHIDKLYVIFLNYTAKT